MGTKILADFPPFISTLQFLFFDELFPIDSTIFPQGSPDFSTDYTEFSTGLDEMSRDCSSLGDFLKLTLPPDFMSHLYEVL